MSTEDTLTGDAGKANRYHFDRHTPEYRERFTEITEDMQARCPVAWNDTYGGHWFAAGNKEVFDIARSRQGVQRPGRNQRAPGLQGHQHPCRAEHRRARRHPRDGPARHSAYRARSTPTCPPPRSTGGYRSSTRSSAPHRREDRDRVDRLRRRPRQHRAGRTHAGHDGPSADGLDDLLRARPRPGLHRRRTPPTCPRVIEHDPGDGHRPADQRSSRSATTRGPVSSTR